MKTLFAVQYRCNISGGLPLGYNVKIQKVERPTNTSFYVNFPAAIAEAAEVQKGETMEWLVEDRNTFILKRVRSRKSFLKERNKP
jgi:antitoxin component of MazEF toxin-antitoxin module